MRLTPHQIAIFKQLAAELFGPQTQLYLFGSRTDDQKSGGDIDLYVTGYTGSIKQQVEAKLLFLTKAKLSIGEQRIDVVFAPHQSQQQAPIHQMAERTGVLL